MAYAHVGVKRLSPIRSENPLFPQVLDIAGATGATHVIHFTDLHPEDGGSVERRDQEDLAQTIGAALGDRVHPRLIMPGGVLARSEIIFSFYKAK